MARQIRIDALATECGVAPREVLRVLIELGHFRYTRFNQQLTEDLAGQVRARLRPPDDAAPPRSAPASEEALFARAMSAAGVQPLDARAAQLAPSARRKKAKPGSRAGRKPPKPVPAPAPAPVPVAVEEQAPPSPAPVEVPAVVPVAVSEPQLDPQLVQASVRCRELELRLAQLEEQTDKLREQQLQDSLQAEALRAERDELQGVAARLVAAAGVGDARVSNEGLLALLQERGLRGLDEAGFALRALLAAHLLDSSLPLLLALDGGRVRRVLAERLCLCCQSENCGIPLGVETVRVPAERCELCGGNELPRIHHSFSDACLLSGITRVMLVGGRRWHHAWIEASSDRRLQLRLRSGSLAALAATLEGDLAWAQLVVVWDDGLTSADLIAAIEQRRSRALVRLGAGSMAQLMRAAAAQIAQLEPSELP